MGVLFLSKKSSLCELKAKQAVLKVTFFTKKEYMKKGLLMILPVVLTACSSPVQQSSVPMDMKTVEEYQKRVASGQTVAAKQTDKWELDKSDKQEKVVVIERRAPRAYPSLHYGYGWGRHHTGIGLGMGY